jgi:hypothetical protein
MAYGQPDRAPYFEEGLRDEVLAAWRRQGFEPEADLGRLMPVDRREEIQPDLDPRPAPKRWPRSRAELEDFRSRLDPEDPARLPDGWAEEARQSRRCDRVVMLRVHRGLFLSMGVYGWDRLCEVAYMLREDPSFVHEMMALQTAFAIEMTRRILDQVKVDAVVFSEPIGGNDRPLVSPQMYEEFALSSYQPLLELVRDRGVETIILRTYANARLLLPRLLERGFNCLWACEVNTEAMDYRELRSELGRDLRLIGGIDLDVLRRDHDDIRREVLEKVPPLLAEGGYVPLADGRVREDVPFEDYLYYRRLLQEVLTANGS